MTCQDMAVVLLVVALLSVVVSAADREPPGKGMGREEVFVAK